LRPIDYIVPTWNSGTTLGITLESIKKYGNPNNIIIVDRNSEDDTLEIARRYGCKILTSKSNLGTARVEGARAAETELIGFVDSDVELTEGWVELLRHAWNGQELYKDVGVFGAYSEGPIVKDSPLVLYGRNGVFGCIITYRSLILDCPEMEKYSSDEDFAYGQCIFRKGLKWYIFPVVMRHHHDLTGISEYVRMRWYGAGLRMRDGFKLVNVRRIIGGAVVGIPMHNPNANYLENWRIRMNYFLGYILYKRYYELNRSKKR